MASPTASAPSAVDLLKMCDENDEKISHHILQYVSYRVRPSWLSCCLVLLDGQCNGNICAAAAGVPYADTEAS